MKKALIIIPCYNEEKRLSVDDFERFSEQNSNLSFVFVNDASTDNTQALLEKICRKNPRLLFELQLANNSGKAEAVRRGFRFGLEKGFEYLGFWDADLSTPLTDIPAFLSMFDSPSVRIVMGSRVQLLGRKIERKTVRHYFGRFFATFASIILKLKVYDTQCGAKMFKGDETLKAVFGSPFNVNWTFDVEILARYLLMMKKSKTRGAVEDSIIEYPLMEWRDVPGSKVKIRDAFIALYELGRIYSFIHFPLSAKRYKRNLEHNTFTKESK
ncbi:MAG: glycosyltransferase [Nitrospinota bacterium]